MDMKDFEVIPHPNKERWPNEAKLRHVPSGEESQYYPVDQCYTIIGHALEGRLKGSFLSSLRGKL